MQYSLHQIQRILRQRKTSLKRRTAIVHDLPVVIYRHRHELERLSEADLRVRLPKWNLRRHAPASDQSFRLSHDSRSC